MIDLTDDPEVVRTLLANPLLWRVRVVEHLELDSAATCLRRRSLQSVPLRSLLPASAATRASDAEHALIVLNIASVPRGALLNLDMEGPSGSQAFLLPRASIASSEADYLLWLAEGFSAGNPSPALRTLLEAALSYVDNGWQISGLKELKRVAPAYLRDGFGSPVPEVLVEDWLAIDDRIAEVLEKYADAEVAFGATVHPVLALPALADEFDATSEPGQSSITSTLREYAALVDAAHANIDPSNPVSDFLRALADYGSHYDMLVAARVPLDEPFIFKYSERRPISFSFWGSEASQEMVISDALSNHIVLSVADPNVRIVQVRANTAHTDEVAYGVFNTRQSDQIYSIYAHEPDRDYEITLQFTLAPLRRLRYVTYLVIVLLILLLVGLLVEAPRKLSDLALVAGPSALAASVLLSREPSTLGSHLRRSSTTALMVALVALLITAVSSYAGLHG